MADWLTSLGHGLDSLMGYLGVSGVNGFNAALCIFAGAIVIWVCIVVPAGIRTALLDGTPRTRRHSKATVALAHE